MNNAHTANALNTSSSLITKHYHDTPLVFREDGWFNMTKAAKHFGKDLSNFWRAPDTGTYVEMLAAVCSVKSTDLSTANRGWHLSPETGTWAHPKLAVFFARWLDVRFSVWCDAVIEDILKGNAELVITALDARFGNSIDSMDFVETSMGRNGGTWAHQHRPDVGLP